MNNTIEFLITKEYKRFVEFCEACRKYRYIGLCYGPPGVGKTLSARRYTQWDLVEPILGPRPYEAPPKEVLGCRTVLYTPPVANHPAMLERMIHERAWSLQHLVEDALIHHEGAGLIEQALSYKKAPNLVDLLVIDEADRLKTSGLEQVRDVYDRWEIGMVLIGMPGIEKRMARYPQLYSRVGFVHHFRALSAEEMRAVLAHKWRELGLSLDSSKPEDQEVVSAIIRMTGGNFRLVQRLFTQIERILHINELDTVTTDVVHAARESLVIGAST